MKVTFGEISLKLCQTNWNVARNNVNVVVDEPLSQITACTCLTIDINGLDGVDVHQRNFMCEINRCQSSMAMNGCYYGHP